jgi:hypothetical protein
MVVVGGSMMLMQVTKTDVCILYRQPRVCLVVDLIVAGVSVI